MSEPAVLACPACGAPTEFGAAFCVFCRGPLTWGAVPVLKRGKLLHRVDGSRERIAAKSTLSSECTANGALITVGPLRSSTEGIGLPRRHGCVVIQAAAVDSNATIGAAARRHGAGPNGFALYSLTVIPHFRTVCLTKVIHGDHTNHVATLHPFEHDPRVGRVGVMSEIELRLADSIIQIFVNGQFVAASIDATFGFGTFGVRVQSITKAPARVLVRSVSVHEVA